MNNYIKGSKSSFRLVLTLLLLLSSFAEAENNPYLDELIARSKEMQLSADPQWLALLHYQKTISGNYHSLASGELFFNSSDGESNPSAELTATLESFFKTTYRKENEEEQPYSCAFIARYKWLKDKLSIKEEKLPKFECTRFKEWYQAINPESLSLIFPASFINNPASAFGHTLLRIDQPDQNEKTRLLAYTANYAALTAGEGALLYAMKGVFGYYPGFFSVAPYYEKVKKYSDLEKRDIWEYKLNFSGSEIEMMLLHLWELRGIPFSYYYFDENCSYQLLSLLDVARPSLKLMESFQTWVIPVDTVKVISEKKLIDEAVFRPSLVTKLQNRINKSSPEVRKAALEYSKDPDFQPASTEPATKAAEIDLAYEYLNYKIIAGKSAEETSQRNAFKLLKMRSTLPSVESPEVKAPGMRPEEGHDTMRVGTSFGRSNDKWFYDLHFRPAYHDLIDPSDGFTRGAAIEVFDTVLRQEEGVNLNLWKASVVDIVSLSPRNEFLTPKSWNLNFGLDRKRIGKDEDKLVFEFEGGLGGSWNLSESLLTYTLLDINTAFNENYDDKYTLGAGPKIGMLMDLSSNIAANLSMDVRKFFAGDETWEYQPLLEGRYTVSRNLALRISYELRRSYNENDNTSMILLDFYL